MALRPKHQRLIFVAASMVFLCISALLVLRAFRENLVFFYSPTDLAERSVSLDRLTRIGGLVEKGSVTENAQEAVHFRVTDGKTSLEITYAGLLPNLFREGQGVVVEGHLTDPQHFAASNVLAKHDERYMPKEVVDALKRSGRWQEGNAP